MDLKYYWGFAVRFSTFSCIAGAHALLNEKIAFDCFAILIAALNSLDKPYRHSSDVVKSILRDGAVWFVVSRALLFQPIRRR